MRAVPLALAVGVICLATTARATPSRVVAMGDIGRYVDDDSNVLIYPGQLGMPKTTHFAFVDLGGPAGLRPALNETQAAALNAGAFVRLSEGLSLGLVTNSFSATEFKGFLGQVGKNADGGNKGTFSFFEGQPALRRYDLIGAWGDKTFGAGARLSFGSQGGYYLPDAKAKTSDDKERLSDAWGQSQIRFAGGVSGSLADGTTYDAAVDYAYHGLSYEKNEKAPFATAGNVVGLNARARLPVLRFWDVVPQVSYRFGSFSMLEDRTAPAFGADSNDQPKKLAGDIENYHSRTSHLLDIGGAAVLRASKTAFFAIATGIEYSTRYDAFESGKTGDSPTTLIDQSQSLYSLPYLKFGFEALVLDWLKLRGGAEKYTWGGSSYDYSKTPGAENKSVTLETNGSTSTPVDESGAAMKDFEAYVGAGIQYNGFILDLVLDREFLRRGPNFVSGAGGNIAGRATLAYKF